MPLQPEPKNANDALADCGVVILCGGQSSRMGRNKSELLISGKPMLRHVLERAARIASNIVLVGKPTPPQFLGDDIKYLFAADEIEDRGPLEGIRVGLRSLADSRHAANRVAGKAHGDAAIILTCDAPLLSPQLARYFVKSLENKEAVYARINQRVNPLPCVLRTSLLNRIEEQFMKGQSAIHQLLGVCDANELSEVEVRNLDPELLSFKNANDPVAFAELIELMQT